jgi:hypothetical protein
LKDFDRWHASKFKGFQQNSLRNRTGNYFGRIGNSGAGAGNFTCQTEIIAE